MKWFWRIYQIDGSYQKAFDIIGGIGMSKSNLSFGYLNKPYIYASFNGTTSGSWSICSPDALDIIVYKDYINEGFEFKGNVGIKEIRKKKLKKIESEKEEDYTYKVVEETKEEI